MGLEIYHKKRDFRRTPEPKGKISSANRQRFVVQEHHASKLHFDFRLEMGGVLKSWSIPRGPSLDPGEKRLAVPTEDHPVEYLKFEGHIPAGEYGAGEHMRWDEGAYQVIGEESALEQLEKGRLNFQLKGEKLRGGFTLVRMTRSWGDQWLLIKSNDEFAEPGWKLKLRMETTEQSEEFRKREEGAGAQTTKKVRKYSPAIKKESSKVMPASRAFKEKELSGDIFVKVGRDVIQLTNLDKVYWPDEGYTKGDLIKYYYEVSKYILPYLKDRPLIMKRYPAGIKGHFFHQHDVDEAPRFVRTVSLEADEDRHVVDYVVGDNLQTLLYMANLGAIERHPWHSRTRNLERPDWFVFDLDPGEGVAFTTICEVAVSVREVLARVGLKSYPKTSGSRGIHVYVPVEPRYDYETIARFAERIARIVATENPQVATVERSLKRRKRGQIYMDHMQNARGKSVVAPYSVRPKAGAPVSAPLEWKEIEKCKFTPQDFTIKNILKRLEKKGDLFRPVLSAKQKLADAIEQAAQLAAK
jgi:bifunctional non-homologous end joining protein LigD